MNRDRNPYPFHDMPRYDAERAARMAAAAVANHDERKRRAARNNRLARLAAGLSEAQIAEQDAILDGILDRLAAQGMVQDDRLIANRNAVERNLEELRERLRAKWRDEAQTSPAVADFLNHSAAFA